MKKTTQIHKNVACATGNAENFFSVPYQPIKKWMNRNSLNYVEFHDSIRLNLLKVFHQKFSRRFYKSYLNWSNFTIVWFCYYFQCFFFHPLKKAPGIWHVKPITDFVWTNHSLHGLVQLWQSKLKSTKYVHCTVDLLWRTAPCNEFNVQYTHLYYTS